jgi:hypothetical protein
VPEEESGAPDYYLIYKKFQVVADSHKNAVYERFETAETLAEAVAMAKDAEHKAVVRRSIVTASPSGRNADERSATAIQLLEADTEYKTVEAEAREHRSMAADVQRRIDVLNDEIKGAREHMRLLANLCSLYPDLD